MTVHVVRVNKSTLLTPGYNIRDVGGTGERVAIALELGRPL